MWGYRAYNSTCTRPVAHSEFNWQIRSLEWQVNSCGKVRRTSDYKFFTEFQSHEAEFDYLKSLEIEEKINATKWCPRVNDSLFLLATNGERQCVAN